GARGPTVSWPTPGRPRYDGDGPSLDAPPPSPKTVAAEPTQVHTIPHSRPVVGSRFVVWDRSGGEPPMFRHLSHPVPSIVTRTPRATGIEPALRSQRRASR